MRLYEFALGLYEKEKEKYGGDIVVEVVGDGSLPSPPPPSPPPPVPPPPTPPPQEPSPPEIDPNEPPVVQHPKYDPYNWNENAPKYNNINNYPEASEEGGWELHPQKNNMPSTLMDDPSKVTLPPELEARYTQLSIGFTDIEKPFDKSKNLAIFWHIPKCGGGILEQLLSNCIGLVEANKVGSREGHQNDETLTVVTHDGSQYVNVDTTTPNGIEHAKELHLASSGLADVALTSYLYDAASLFTNNGNTVRGKCFTMLRHPIKRAVSIFYYLKETEFGDANLSIFKDMSLEEYARSQWCEENWMVRFLTNEMKGALTEDHLTLAMRVLQNKCFVGLLEEFDASLLRYEMYFNWGKVGDKAKRTECTKMMEQQSDTSDTLHPVEEGDEVWSLLEQKNLFDMKLYEFALDLYEEFSGYG